MLRNLQSATHVLTKYSQSYLIKSRECNNRYNSYFLYSVHLSQIKNVIIMYSSHDETAQLKILVHLIYHQL